MTDKKTITEDNETSGRKTAYQKLAEAAAVINILFAAAFITFPVTKPLLEGLFGFQRDKIEQDYVIRRNSERITKLENDLTALTERVLPRTPVR